MTKTYLGFTANEANANLDSVVALARGSAGRFLVTDPLYGAVGNGVTNDTAAINAAIAAGSGGGIIEFPAPGTYLVDGLVANRANQRWIIRPGATVKLKPLGSAPVIDITASHVTVEGGGTIDGNRAGLPTGSARIGVRAVSVTGATVRDLTIQNCADEAILADNVTTFRAIENTTYGCQQAANAKVLHLTDTFGDSTDVLFDGNTLDCTAFNTSGINASAIINGRTLRDIRSVNNRVLVGDGGASYPTLGIEYFTNNGGTICDSLVAENEINAPNTTNTQIFGISIGGNATAVTNGNINTAVDNNVVRDCGNVAIELIGKALTATGNETYNCGFVLITAGNQVGGVSGVTFVGNDLYNMRDGNYGIRMDGSTTGMVGVIVADNLIYKAKGEGIWLFGIISDSEVCDNVVTSPGLCGIVVDGAATLTDVDICDNNIDLTGAAAASDGILLNSGTSSHLAVSRNRIRSATRNGIWFNGAFSHMTVQQNIVRACGLNGIVCSSGDQWLISGNKTSSNGNTGLSLAAITNVDYYGNKSYSNTVADENYGTATFTVFQVPLLTVGGVAGQPLGTPVKQIKVYTPTLVPAAVPPQSGNGQTFNVPGLTTDDTVFVDPPAPVGPCGIGQARVSAADTLEILYVNATVGAITPTPGTFRIFAIRT